MYKTTLKLTYDFGIHLKDFYVPVKDVMLDEIIDLENKLNVDTSNISDESLSEMLIDFLNLPRTFDISVEDEYLLADYDYIYDLYLGDVCSGFAPKYEDMNKDML